MTGDIATRLRNTYDSLVISINFVNSIIARTARKIFFDNPVILDGQYNIENEKLYNINFTGVANPVINLTTAFSILQAECPEWHFFMIAGNNAPLWAYEGDSIEISWSSVPVFTSGTRYEIDIIYVNSGDNDSFEGVIIEQTA